MKLKSIIDVLQGKVPLNEEITINGWVRTRRDSKSGISFLIIQDGSCSSSLQFIVSNRIKNYQNDILKLTTGCSVSITGNVIKSLGSKQHYEIFAKYVKVLGWIDNPSTYPISTKKHSVEYLRKVAHLRPRTRLISSVARVRHVTAQSIHHFMNDNGFIWISTPLITTLNTEGSGEMFRVSTLDLENLPRTSTGKIDYSKDFFGKESFLTVSGQLNGESYACALSKIYTFGPTFRAENSNTNRHLSEFWMVEPEIAFSNLEDIICLAELLLKHVVQSVLNQCINDIDFFSEYSNSNIKDRLTHFIDTNFIKIDYSKAISILSQYNCSFKNQISWGVELSSEHERYLSDRYFRMPVVIKNYPKMVKAFYMRENNDNKTVASMDILIPGIGEIIGGSQREERLEKLDSRLEEAGLSKEKYWWYRDLRRYGSVPHSGFGLGFDRLVKYITGIKNIRDVIPFPRSVNNAEF